MGDVIRFPLERRKPNDPETAAKGQPFFGLRLRPDAPAVYVLEGADGSKVTYTITTGAEFITGIEGGTK